MSYIGPFRDLGKSVRALRQRRGMTHERLAEAAQISPSNLSAYENGKSKMQVETLDRIMVALNYDVGDLAVELGQVPSAAVMIQKFEDLRNEVREAVAAAEPSTPE